MLLLSKYARPIFFAFVLPHKGYSGAVVSMPDYYKQKSALCAPGKCTY